MSVENMHDPRARLVREKYFSLRPRPLERWLWAQGIPASAERVFWLHWQEGLQRRDWCSEIPLKRVARECCLDPSTVTRAYQLLARLGCLRRTDPGRDAANPFQQATAITEVRVPRELLQELGRHPNRRSDSSPQPQPPETPAAVDPHSPTSAAAARPKDPFGGLRGRERIQALQKLLRLMSPVEESHYREAARLHQSYMEFGADSKLSAEQRGRELQFLACLAIEPVAAPTRMAPVLPAAKGPRKLSIFELARLKRDIQAVTGVQDGPELLQQVVWSIEEGSLLRFSPLHASHIAVKKIREGAWTRPHRMPPNWARRLDAPLQTCRRA